jgi:hypothetical protein
MSIIAKILLEDVFLEDENVGGGYEIENWFVKSPQNSEEFKKAGRLEISAYPNSEIINNCDKTFSLILQEDYRYFGTIINARVEILRDEISYLYIFTYDKGIDPNGQLWCNIDYKNKEVIGMINDLTGENYE